LSYNQQTNQIEYKQVPWIYERYGDDIFEITIAGERAPIDVSVEHPFYVKLHRARDSLGDDQEGRPQWKAVQDLQPGDQVLRADGTWADVLSVHQLQGGAKLYNFEVADNHDYFVGQIGALVHNKCTYNANGGTIERETTKKLWSNLGTSPVPANRAVHHLIPGKGSGLNILQLRY
jgi:hypothetical protein